MRIWKASTADNKFSKFIRNRDKKCVRCGGIKNLQCSHFFSRVHWSTRYDRDNCITICYPCHYGNLNGWEYDQAGEYQDFMIKKLGKNKFKALKEKHYQQITKREAIEKAMTWLK